MMVHTITKLLITWLATMVRIPAQLDFGSNVMRCLLNAYPACCLTNPLEHMLLCRHCIITVCTLIVYHRIDTAHMQL